MVPEVDRPRAGTLARVGRPLGARPLVFVGEASYCLYILHFNLWNWIHETHLPERLGVARFDPWLSFVFLIAVAVAAMLLVEKPAQRQLRKWMGA